MLGRTLTGMTLSNNFWPLLYIIFGHLYLSMLPRAECLLALGTLEAELVPVFTEGGLSLS